MGIPCDNTMTRNVITFEVDATWVVRDVGSYEDTAWWFGVHEVASVEGGVDSLGG